MQLRVALGLCAVAMSFVAVAFASPVLATDDAVPLDDDDDDGAANGPASCTGVIFDAEPKPATVTGKTLCEVDASRRATITEQQGAVGHIVVTIPKPSKVCLDKEGKLKNVSVTYTLKARYPEWTAPEGVEENEQIKIEAYIKRIRRHEEMHVEHYRTALSAVRIVGRTAAEFNDAVDAATAKAEKESEDLDNSEGCLKVTTINPNSKNPWCVAEFKGASKCSP